MADAQVSGLTELSVVANDDKIYVVDTSAGTSGSKYIEASNLINHVSYASDIARDTALASPVDGMMIYNQQRNCVQVYHATVGCWLGFNPSDCPVFIDALHRYNHVLPVTYYNVEYNSKLFDVEHGAYSDGERVFEAAASGLNNTWRPEPTTSSGIIAYAGSGAWQRSTNGVAAYASVLTGTDGGNLVGSLCDLGSSKLLLFTYGLEVYYSVDGGANWGDNSPGYDDGDPLFTANSDAITHFHGAVYDSTNSRLYAFTGDGDIDSDDDMQCSILLCDDVADFAANPSTWAARWGVDDATRSNLDSDYVIGSGSQKYRVIHACFSGDYMYTGSDGVVSGRGFGVYRVHRTTGAIQDIFCHAPSVEPTTYTVGSCVGVPWAWGTTPDGMVVFATASEYTGGAYRSHTDKYVRVYAMLDDGRQAVEIHRAERTDSSSPGETIVNPWRVCNLRDVTVFSGSSLWPPCAGYIGKPSAAKGWSDPHPRVSGADYTSTIKRAHAPQAPVNWIANGRVIDDTTGWNDVRCTSSREVTIVDHGNVASLKVEPDASGANCNSYFLLSDDHCESIRGNMVTVAVRVYCPNPRQQSQTPMIEISGTTETTRILLNDDSYFDDDWHEVTLTAYIPADCSSLYVKCSPQYTTIHADHGPVYFSDLRMGIGLFAPPECSAPMITVE